MMFFPLFRRLIKKPAGITPAGENDLFATVKQIVGKLIQLVEKDLK